MRPTPRTDAFERARQKFSGEPDALTVEYARALERDLAEAVEIASWLNEFIIEPQFFPNEGDSIYWHETLAHARAFLKRMEQK